MKSWIRLVSFSALFLFWAGCFDSSSSYQRKLGTHLDHSAIIIDHTCTDRTVISDASIALAISNLHIAYGHTSHGSQLMDGLDGLAAFDTRFATLPEIRNCPFEGAYDLGNPDRTAWVHVTEKYLNNPDTQSINVIMWSWCGQANGSEGQISDYLEMMDDLEEEFPDVIFVYMTGHLVGTGNDGNLDLRNEQIRTYCKNNEKVLYDFADIESYDPDGNEYMTKYGDDACNYDANSSGGIETDNLGNPINGDKNWAIDWQNNHTEGTDWYDSGSAHSQPLNANRKAYAAWNMFAKLAKVVDDNTSE